VPGFEFRERSVAAAGASILARLRRIREGAPLLLVVAKEESSGGYVDRRWQAEAIARVTGRAT
jgi:hypothetical protein